VAADQDEPLCADLLREADERCTQALGLAEVDVHLGTVGTSN
jgi:hypothetical protein